MYYKDIPKDQHPIGFFENYKSSYGDLKDEDTYKKYAADVFSRHYDF